MTRDPGNPFAYYFRNLQRKAQRTRGSALFKHDPSVSDEALTDEYLVSQLLVAGTPNEVAERLAAFREQVGPFGRLLYGGHDWADARAMRRSMELMAEKVLPQL
jgi:alkanesulfonate monooxygenase SsuD/methylene tetrahydromethanopterin reductase-like flavin-dependent oxidoreductase (luciferase family)